jgi:hypothetical protein
MDGRKVRDLTSFIKMSGGHSSADHMRERVAVLDGFHTPREAVVALMKCEQIHDNVWEPANGFSRISRVLREYGLRVATSDIHRWHSGTKVERAFADFSDLPSPFRRNGCDIITNPPFVRAQEFVEHSMDLLHDGGRLCLLLRLQFLEGNKRADMFKKYPPLRVHVFSYRLPRMHRFLYRGPQGGSTIAFAWFVWSKGYKGPTEIKWITR